MFSEKDAPTPKLDGLGQSDASEQAGCPVIFTYVQVLRSFLPPYLLRALGTHDAAVAEAESSPEIQMARALRLTEYVVKECLTDGLARFNLHRDGDKLRTLPLLSSPAMLEAYLDAVKDLRATPWNPTDHGVKMFRAALLRPLESTEQAITLLAAGDTPRACELLAPALERQGRMAALIPLLDELLAIR